MKEKFLPFLLILCFLIMGCSRKPNASDVEASIIATWEPCGNLKVSDIKKTNGIDQGNTYIIGVSYKLEVLDKDLCHNDLEGTELNVARFHHAIGMLHFMATADGKRVVDLKKGGIINAHDTYTMVQSEEGWIIQ